MSLLRTAVILEAAPTQQRLLEEGAALASCATMRWRAGAPVPDPAPAVLLGVLPRGQRRLPPEIAELADRHLTGVPVLLLSDDPLVRPTLLLAGGRLTLLDTPATAEAIAGGIHAAIERAHRPDLCHQTPSTWRGRRWSAVLLGGDPAAIVATEGGLVGVVGNGDAPLATRDLVGMAPACREPFAASRLMPSLLARAGVNAVAVLLPGEAGPWSLARRGSALVQLASHRRLPSLWSLPPSQEVRLMPALRGDLVILGTDLPALPDLHRVAAEGLDAVAAHAREQAALAGRPVNALIVEVVR